MSRSVSSFLASAFPHKLCDSPGRWEFKTYMDRPPYHRTVFLARVATLLYTIAICVLSLIPGNQVPLHTVSDKYRHAAAYAVFAILLGASLIRVRFGPTVLAFLGASIVGVGMEVLQPYFGRSRDVLDATANSVGAALGCGMLVAVIAISTKAMSCRNSLKASA